MPHEDGDFCDRSGCQVREAIEQVRETLYGNGKPEVALLTRVTLLEQRVKAVYRLSWAALVGIIGIATQMFMAYFEARLKHS